MAKYNEKDRELLILAYSQVNLPEIPVHHFAKMIGVRPDTVKRRYPKQIVKKEGEVLMIKTMKDIRN